MAEARYAVAPLGREHDRAAFSCGVPALDRYLRQQAGQDIRHNVAAVFVMVDLAEPNRIVGYYTISACGIDPATLPPEFTRRLPRYPHLPALLLGRLAIDRQFRGQGFGAGLLHKALSGCLDLRQRLGALAVVVDAKDDAARSFYERHGFQPFQDQPYRLFIPMSAIAKSLPPPAHQERDSR